MRLTWLAVLIAAVLLGACAHNRVIQDFTVSSGQAKQEMPEGRSADALTANGVSTEWTIGDTGIKFRLKNLYPNTIRVLWDESVIVDQGGVVHPVIHSGVPFIARNQPQTPSIVLAGTIIEDIIAPKDQVAWQGPRWNLSRLFAETLSKGDSFRVVLSLDNDGRKSQTEYMFQVSGLRCEIHDAPLNRYLIPNQPCT